MTYNVSVVTLRGQLNILTGGVVGPFHRPERHQTPQLLALSKHFDVYCRMMSPNALLMYLGQVRSFLLAAVDLQMGFLRKKRRFNTH